ncbi:PucR family transcriptional regulator [Nocardia jiangxiensis]|uniref:PucR family transcriptional regulator n=1 Tax=Nocardia jiangxiensis TaxID=282685 RepID=A0ABW6S0X4_9NOCA|nr:helix-turn-helix domain-containing protein [Nocardia jiangxiensis]
MTIDSLARLEPHALKQPMSPSVREVDTLTRVVLARLAESAEISEQSEQFIAADIKNVVRACTELMIQGMNGGPLPCPAERLENAAAGCARADIPIDAVLSAIRTGSTVVLDQMFARTSPANCAGVHTATMTILELSKVFTAAVGMAYVRERRAEAAEQQTAAHSLTSALLAGTSTATAGARELPIADRYFVLALGLAAHPDESRPHLDRQVVARRKLRRVQAELATALAGEALSLLSVDGGTVLVPSTAATDSELEGLVGGLSRAARTPITVTVVTARPHEVPGAAHLAHELLDTVQHLGLGPGLYRFTELALQYQLTRPGIARDALETQLTPLDEHPDLLETLRIYIAANLSRVRTARLLDVHPNTVDYRLRRIAGLTGFDPSQTTGLWYLHSALVARMGRHLTPATPLRLPAAHDTNRLDSDCA